MKEKDAENVIKYLKDNHVTVKEIGKYVDKEYDYEDAEWYFQVYRYKKRQQLKSKICTMKFIAILVTSFS